MIIGLNSALLSCNNEDSGKLVIDQTRFNELLTGSQADEQLIIVVSHHPVGRVHNANKAAKRSLLVPWNSNAIENCLLQRTGPHIYLHGHLHHASGTSVSYSHGQNLSICAAGASYDHDSYPQQFAFYEIDLAVGRIVTFLYSYKGGEWRLDRDLSYSTTATLPKPKGITEQSVVSKFAGLRDLTKEVIFSYQRLGNELRKTIPRFAPELENLINPGIRKNLREGQHLETGFKILVEDIDEKLMLPNLNDSVKKALQEAKGLVLDKKLQQAIRVLEGHYLQAHRELLMTARVVSEDPRDWEEAEQSLAALGRPWHYVTLSYNAWSMGDLDKALPLAEKAITVFQQQNEENGVKDPIHKLWNNLAYFFAEEGKRGKEALRFASDAVSALKEETGYDEKQLANYMDTLGFTRIVFAEAKEDVINGITECEDARRLGGGLSLYFQHLSLAEVQLERLPERRDPGSS